MSHRIHFGLVYSMNSNKSRECHRHGSLPKVSIASRKWRHPEALRISQSCEIWKQVRGSSPAYLDREFSGQTCSRTLAAGSWKITGGDFELVAVWCRVRAVRFNWRRRSRDYVSVPQRIPAGRTMKFASSLDVSEGRLERNGWSEEEKADVLHHRSDFSA